MRDEAVFLTSKNMLEKEGLLCLRTWSVEDENRMSSEPLKPQMYFKYLAETTPYAALRLQTPQVIKVNAYFLNSCSLFYSSVTLF